MTLVHQPESMFIHMCAVPFQNEAIVSVYWHLAPTISINTSVKNWIASGSIQTIHTSVQCEYLKNCSISHVTAWRKLVNNSLTSKRTLYLEPFLKVLNVPRSGTLGKLTGVKVVSWTVTKSIIWEKRRIFTSGLKRTLRIMFHWKKRAVKILIVLTY